MNTVFSRQLTPLELAFFVSGRYTSCTMSRSIPSTSRLLWMATAGGRVNGVYRSFSATKRDTRTSKIADACFDRGIGVATFFAFSTENWNRSEAEVAYLLKLQAPHSTRKSRGSMREISKFASSAIFPDLHPSCRNECAKPCT